MQPHGFVRNIMLALCAAAPWSAAGHTVLVEGGSMSWCSHCAVASAEMYALYSSGVYDVCYLAYVADGNSGTIGRMDELGVTSTPHYAFDGGFDTWVGSGELPQAYTTRLETCAARAVPDLALDVRAVWEGDALVSCTLGVANRSGAAYAAAVSLPSLVRVSSMSSSTARTPRASRFERGFNGRPPARRRDSDVQAGIRGDVRDELERARYGG